MATNVLPPTAPATDCNNASLKSQQAIHTRSNVSVSSIISGVRKTLGLESRSINSSKLSMKSAGSKSKLGSAVMLPSDGSEKDKQAALFDAAVASRFKVAEIPAAVPPQATTILHQTYESQGAVTQLQGFYAFLVKGLVEMDIPWTQLTRPNKSNQTIRTIKQVSEWFNDPTTMSSSDPSLRRFSFTTVATPIKFDLSLEIPLPQLLTDMKDADALQLGIYYHEQEDYAVALRYYSSAAGGPGCTSESSNPIAMYLLGVCLRHGWGCQEDKETSFAWLALAAAYCCLYPTSMVIHSTSLLEQLKASTSLLTYSRNPLNSSTRQTLSEVVRNVLPLPIYELGISLQNGWGISRSKPIATYLFRLAAYLGDADSAVQYGYCLMTGDGIIKDKMEAAKWFRHAERAGLKLVGETWMYKQKWGYIEGGVESSPTCF
ncbi:hypothetical protein SmJEL517_g01921 [Synchytrium microbalum]|uniref:Uncharacterized protein n=1 Tax=Synchytrium microbalum TaxID=1806994 RepID=A0A507C2D1_9FUNG|nr:uncharacterized protein SmJEL517_g01921 [Synchytrium microbalum]TPX35670.1 hypothetical protein SmJEL517_g01921 [Synchytrium microbalum]